MLPEGWYLAQHFVNVVEPVTNIRVPVQSLYESVPIKISSIDIFEFLEQILAFNSADGDTDVTVKYSLVVWSCPLIS